MPEPSHEPRPDRSHLRAAQGLFTDGKTYNFIDFIRLSQIYVEKTGDRRTVFATYALTIVGSVLSVGSWLTIVMKLNLPK